MPEEREHKATWRRNHKLLDHLKASNAHQEWVIVVAFYTALHSVEQYLARKNRHPRTHDDMKYALNRLNKVLTPQVLNSYMDLYNASRDMRYRCLVPDNVEVREQLRNLAVIDEKIDSLLKV